MIVPVRDQQDALAVTMAGFGAQDCGFPWELIVVDDGSTDRSAEVAMDAGLANMRLVALPPGGRSAARNAGIAAARGDTLILCDGDRAPGRSFVAAHVEAHGRSGPGSVVVGDILEFYVSDLPGRTDEFRAHARDGFTGVRRLARRPPYPAAVLGMFRDGVEEFSVPWIAFFSGNVSLPHGLHPLFDEDFQTWGFEHFELGLRLHGAGARFRHAPAAANYHFAHRREEGFYGDALRTSFGVLQGKHPAGRVAAFWRFLHGEISLEELDAIARAELGLPPVPRPAASFYRQLGGPR